MILTVEVAAAAEADAAGAGVETISVEVEEAHQQAPDIGTPRLLYVAGNHQASFVEEWSESGYLTKSRYETYVRVAK